MSTFLDTKEAKRFFRGKKWSKKQRKELDKQEKPPLKLNRVPKIETLINKG